MDGFSQPRAYSHFLCLDCEIYIDSLYVRISTFVDTHGIAFASMAIWIPFDRCIANHQMSQIKIKDAIKPISQQRVGLPRCSSFPYLSSDINANHWCPCDTSRRSVDSKDPRHNRNKAYLLTMTTQIPIYKTVMKNH